MIEYFNKDIVKDFNEHAKETFPNECCGIISEDKYIPCANTADNKRWNFRINPVQLAKYYRDNNLQAIVHSHCDEVGVNNNGRKVILDYGHASKDDMERQIESKVPYGIVHLNVDGNPMKTFFWGDELPVQDLVGRPFIHGLYDCYGLVRDYFKKEFNITLKQYPRQFGWWNIPGNSSLLLDNVIDAGFELIDNNEELKKGDFIFMTIMAKMVNHCSVYMGGGLILHHLCNRLSCIEPVQIYQQSISNYVRYRGNLNAS
jgi:proteasome lid subunit RPN8/RPN11